MAQGQHAKRFSAVGAQKGTPLRSVVDQLKALADTVEEHYDPNSPEVTDAMQRFEQGLNRLKGAPLAEEAEQPEEDPKPKRASRSSRRDGDTPTNAAEGQGSGES